VTEKHREEDQSSLDWISEPLESWLVGALQRDTKVPLNAFKKLCDKCDKNFLVWHFATLATPSFEPDPLPKEFEHFPQKPREKVQMFPLDSWKTATDDQTPDDLRSVANGAEHLMEQIERLRKTRLVRILAALGKIRRGDLLHPDCNYKRRFEGILGLPESAKYVGPQKKAEYNEVLAEIVLHVHDCTGKWHDSSLSEILQALGLPQSTPEALKQWRQGRGLVDKKR